MLEHVENNDNDDAGRASRLRHDLRAAEGAPPLNGWVAKVPLVGADGGEKVVALGTVAKMTLGHATIGADVGSISVLDSLITQEAFNRCMGIWQEMLPEQPRGHKMSMAQMQMGLVGLVDATPAQRDALTIRAPDLVQAEGEPAEPQPLQVGEGVSAQQVQERVHERTTWAAAHEQRAWMRHVTFSMLADPSSGRMTALGRLMEALPHWGLQQNLESAAFQKAASRLVNAALRAEGVPATEFNDIDAEERADIVAAHVRSVDIPPWAEDLAAGSWPEKLRMLTLEIEAAHSPEKRRKLLAERFITAAACIHGVRAIIGVQDDGSCALSSAEAYGLCAETAARCEAATSEGSFCFAELRTLGDRAAPFDDLMRQAPWSDMTARQRADHVVTMWHEQQRRMRTPAAPLPSTSGGGSGTTPGHRLGRGAIPKHFEHDIESATSTPQYRELKAAIVKRIGLGGDSMELDVLQLAASGRPPPHVDVNGAHVVPQRVWCPLIVMMAEGDAHGINAELIDPDLRQVSMSGGYMWAELYGRAAGRQLSPDKVTLHENLNGAQLTTLAAQFSKEDWSKVDIPAAFRAIRAMIRGGTPAASQGKAYATKASVEEAFEIAEVVMSLRGYTGAGEGTLPYALDEVRETWLLYGGPAAPKGVNDKLAEEGSAYITAILKYFGTEYWKAISGKNYTSSSPRTPPQATLQPRSTLSICYALCPKPTRGGSCLRSAPGLPPDSRSSR